MVRTFLKVYMELGSYFLFLQEQIKDIIISLLTGLQAVGQVKGWKVQQIVFVGGTCGSVYVESFNRIM